MSVFDKVRFRKVGKSTFNLSHEKKLSMNMGELVPILTQEIIPGDKFRVNTEAFIRLAPLVAPVMQRINAYVHFFFVPNRLIWNEWEDFITLSALDASFPVMPYTEGIYYHGSLVDYMGIPTVKTGGSESHNVKFQTLPFRAYQEIYNEYYRNQHLQNAIDYYKGSGQEPDGEVLGKRFRNWEKDYFTSALPWAQRGPDVLLPMDNQITYKSQGELLDSTGTPSDGTANAPINAVGTDAHFEVNGINGPINIANIDSIESELTIRELRRANKVQEWFEKAATGGARYTEKIWSHFGVRSKDSRLQRPEYLGGGRAPVQISEVLNTTGTENAAQGEMAGHGVSLANTNSFSRYFTEHGYVIGILSVMPRTNYQQGVPRQYLKDHPLDFYWPEFANIGEQEVYENEIYHDYNDDQQDGSATWGYQQRYAEYKYNPSTVHGDFKEDLSHWHQGRIFQDKPALNATFVRSNPDTRIFAVPNPSSQKLYCTVYNNIKAIRPIPYYGTPQL